MKTAARVVLTGGVIFLGEGAARAGAGFALSAGAVVAYRELSPYLATSANALCTAGTWQVALTFAAGVVVLGRPFELAGAALPRPVRAR